MKTTTVEMYKVAHSNGKRDAESGELRGYHTAALDVAYDLGYEGKVIDFENIVDCVRAGNVPSGGVSYNYRDQLSEKGLSVLFVEGEPEIASSIWFDRAEVKVSGIRLPYTGSDGETLILPLEIEQYDF